MPQIRPGASCLCILDEYQSECTFPARRGKPPVGWKSRCRATRPSPPTRRLNIDWSPDFYAPSSETVNCDHKGDLTNIMRPSMFGQRGRPRFEEAGENRAASDRLSGSWTRRRCRSRGALFGGCALIRGDKSAEEIGHVITAAVLLFLAAASGRRVRTVGRSAWNKESAANRRRTENGQPRSELMCVHSFSRV